MEVIRTRIANIIFKDQGFQLALSSKTLGAICNLTLKALPEMKDFDKLIQSKSQD